jgi:predicted component of type VI protein secretion system
MSLGATAVACFCAGALRGSHRFDKNQTAATGPVAATDCGVSCVGSQPNTSLVSVAAAGVAWRTSAATKHALNTPPHAYSLRPANICTFRVGHGNQDKVKMMKLPLQNISCLRPTSTARCRHLRHLLTSALQLLSTALSAMAPCPALRPPCRALRPRPPQGPARRQQPRPRLHQDLAPRHQLCALGSGPRRPPCPRT